MRLILLGLLAGVVAAGCGAAPPPYRPVADVKQMMATVIDPAADVVWGSVATIISETGIEERRPRTAEEWDAVLGSAIIVMESGNLLMMGARAKDGQAWMERAREQIEAGEAAVRAAQARNADGILAAGERIDAACEACHKLYLPENSDAAR